MGWGLLDVIIPPRCGGCKRWGERWCADCQNSIRRINHPICQQCGIPVSSTGRVLCDHCQADWTRLDRLRAWAYYEGPIQEGIRDIKYHRNFGLAETFGKFLANLLDSLNWPIQVVVPVPLSPARLRERGYNQAQLLAKPIAYSHGIPLRPAGLQRTRNTTSQVGLSRKQRIRNVSHAFTVDPETVAGYNVLVVDDVVTTGATMNACAAALKIGKASKIFGLAVARSFQEIGRAHV